MATKLDIISNARILLADTPVYDLNEIPEQEYIFNSLYRNMLQMKYWKFSLKRAELSRITEAPLFGYKYAFQLPFDFANLTRFDNDINVTSYEILGDQLLCDNEEMRIEFTSLDTPVESCTPMVVKYLEYQTAAELSYLITEDKTIANNFIALATRQLNKAASRDSMNERSKTIWKSQFEYARRSGTRSTINGLNNTKYWS
tara:strand:- start:1550 stop:2152 length:603 start_codon:yes stop_codon:yes gene_type:complete